MADTGAPYFIPYVEPTDLVRDYPAADEASADAIAAALDAIPVLAGIGSNVVQTVKTDTFSTTSNTFVDVTGLSVTITPTSASSKILIAWSVSLGATQNVDNTVHLLLADGSDAPLLQGDASGSRTRVTQGYRAFSANAAFGDVYSGFSLVSPGSTSAFTAKIRVRRDTVDTVFVNQTGSDLDQTRTGRSTSTITAIEVAA